MSDRGLSQPKSGGPAGPRNTALWRSLLDRAAPQLSIRRQALQVLGAAARQAPADPRGAAGALAASLRSYRAYGCLIFPPPAVPAARPPFTYADWIAANEPDAAGLAQQADAWRQWPLQPIISIVVPVFNPPVPVLAATIEAVLAQSYGRWELVLVNAEPQNAAVAALLEEAFQRSAQVKLITLAANGGISRNSNAGLDAAAGEFVLFLDHDDLLSCEALFRVVEAIQTAPDADILYYDEDKVAADGGERTAPWFKPDWSPDLMLSTNLLMHGIYRRTLVEAVGRLDPAADGAQDWDLALRAAASARRVVHIPRVLYHWRQLPGSAAASAAAKPWAIAAQQRALAAQVERSGAGVEVSPLGAARIRFPAQGALVSIIIPTRDKVDLLRACLHSLLAGTTYRKFEILLVDTGSREPATWDYYASLSEEPAVRLLHWQHNFNYSAVNNWAAQEARGDLLLFLNNDTAALDPEWLEEMAGWAMRPAIGVVGAQLVRPDGTLQHAGIVLGLAGHGSHVFDGVTAPAYTVFGSTEWVRNYQAVTGACMMVRRSVFAEVAGFDECYVVGYSDIEFCLRVQAAGYRNIYTPYARLLHHEGGTRGLGLPAGDVLRATLQLGGPAMAGDPYFNPNLSVHERAPALARPDELPAAGQVGATLIQILQSFALCAPDRPIQELAAVLPEPPSPCPWPAAVPAPEDPCRILLVTHDFSLSGAPLLLLSLAEILVRQGYAVHVISPEDGPLRARFAGLGITVTLDDAPGRLRDNALAFGQAVCDCDLVIANTILMWRAIHAAKAYQKPVIWWIHESQFGVGEAQRLASVAQALAAADLLVFEAMYSVDLFQPFLAAVRRQVIYSSVDPAEVEPFRAAPGAGAPRAPLRVVHLGSVEKRKGQDVLLQAAAALPDPDRFEFCLAGRDIEPDYADALRAAARTFSNVQMLGPIDRTAALRLLASADVVVVPSRDEVLPISLIEAMLMEKPIIAARAGAIAETIKHGANGLLFDPGDSRALANLLACLAEDAELRDRLGRQARCTAVDQFNPERFAAEFLAAVESVRQQAGAQPALAPRLGTATAA